MFKELVIIKTKKKDSVLVACLKSRMIAPHFKNSEKAKGLGTRLHIQLK